jgi:hypothetical protein
MSFAPSPDLTKPNHGASGPPGDQATVHRGTASRSGENPGHRSTARRQTLPRAPVAPKRLGAHARLVVAKWRAPRTAQPVRAWRGRPPPFTSLGGRSDLALPFGSPCPRARARERERESERVRLRPESLGAEPSGGVWCVRRAPWLPVGSTVLVLPFGFCAPAGGPCGCGALRLRRPGVHSDRAQRD